MKEIRCNLLVIGAGPGGYTCAARAGEQGVDTVIVEADRVGGTCLNVGCIPSKAVIHAADEYARARAFSAQRSPLGIRVSEPAIDLAQTVAWKDAIVERLDGGVSGMLKKARVKVVLGRARFRDGKTVVVSTETGGEQTIRAENVVIATGSRPIELPMLPFGGNVVSSTELLSMRELPARLVVVGAGYIGVELGTAFAKLGAQVTMVDLAPRILPQYDVELTRPVVQRLSALGVQLRLGATVKSASPDGQLSIETGAGVERLPADRILVAVGRRPAIDGFALDELDLDHDGPFVRIDDRCRTSMRGVYAIGDVTGEPMLAHRAMMQGEVVADVVAGRKRVFEPRAIPAICFTDPEIVVVGPALEEARRAHAELRVGMVPFTANGRALTLQAESGFVRIVARADNHLVLSIQAVGAAVSELSAAFGLALEMGARLEDIAGTIHAHPTLGEAVQEAAQRALGRG
ncbi:MAG: dihydrolipoyl dehydrogenase [Burkholderiaceae bacterium]|nr:dihydrolipoyl dehydrogenase [Burkholderiaceae bacterium]